MGLANLLEAYSDGLTPEAEAQLISREELVVNVKRRQVRQAGADQTDTAYIARLRQGFEGNLYAFAYTIMGFTRFKPGLHDEVCAFLQTVPPRRKMILMPRDTFKTSCGRALALHILLQPPERNCYFPNGISGIKKFAGCDARILFASETGPKADEQIGVIRQHCESNHMLRALWPNVIWDNPGGEAPKWTGSSLTMKRTQVYPEPSILSIGVGGRNTGRHFTVFILDDITALEAMKSKAVLSDALRWYGLTLPLHDDMENGLEFVLGTRWVMGDLADLIWEGPRYSSADLDGFAIYKRSAEEDGHAIFPEHLSMERLRKLKLPPPVGVGDLYPLLYMNDPLDPSRVVFNMSKLRSFVWLDDDCIGYAPDSRDQQVEVLMKPPKVPLPAGLTLNEHTYRLLHPGDDDNE